MRAWVVTNPGDPSALKLESRPEPEPRADWIKIRIRGFGINRSELYTRQGHSGDDVPFPRVLGIECAGEVVDAGGTDLEVGDRVVVAMGGMGRRYDGGYAEFTLAPRRQVMRIESDLPWATLAAFPETYFTAWTSIFDDLKAKPGQTILVRGGTSSVGLAALQILSDLGCRTIATTRGEAKRARLMDAGCDDVVIDGGTIASAVRALVPEGVDGVLELVGSVASVADSAKTIRPGGHLCHTGLLAGEWGRELDPMPAGVGYSFGNSDRVEYERWTPIAQTIADRLAAGRYSPNIDTVFEFEEVVAAHERMENNRAAGKLVVVHGPADQ
ncbi:MAG: zinc-binding dehydrogenase [Myxococcota bacterium]